MDSPRVDRALIALLSVLAAVTVGNLYLAQPLLVDIGRDLHSTSSTAGFLVTLGQVGYGLGVLFLVPLGDLVERRRLLLTLLMAVSLLLLGAALSPTIEILAIVSLLIGLATVIPQIVVPYAASLANDRERASVLGTVQAALLMGILLARTFSGAVASFAGWRGVFVAGAILCTALLIGVSIRLPKQPVVNRSSYVRVLETMLNLALRERSLHRTAIMGALNFAVFTSFWTTLPFLLEREFHQGSATAGLFGLVGAAGALAAGLAGRMINKYGAQATQVLALVVTYLVRSSLARRSRHDLAHRGSGRDGCRSPSVSPLLSKRSARN